MVKKFIDNFNPKSEERDYIFKNENIKIESNDYDKPIEKLVKKEPFIIEVEKNIKIIQCPKCNYGDCVVSLMHYSTAFYNCEHKHLQISSYDNYFLSDQIYNPESIRCAGINGNNCTKNAKMDPNFQLCLTCSKLDNQTQSICSECIEKHKHLVVSSYDNYETDQNYFPEKILCCGNECRQNAKTDPNFLLCLTCSKTCNKTKSICNNCFIKHIEDLN